MSAVRAEDLIIGITPFREPDARLAAAVSRAGGLGVLDLGDGGRQARDALGRLRSWAPSGFGVRLAGDCRIDLGELARGAAARGGDGPHTVVLGAESAWQVGDVAACHRVLVEVTDLEQALTAARAGADGLIARGAESGGRVGELSTFVLLQQLLDAPELDVPVWACGGIGPRTAAAAVAGGAA
ncbi:nitronate monooxygenase, partial [Streptomyces sp. NPDC005827]|uniref:nitronate monooxygenase n=1 Tax=Streptomyces sp. NPDC005827 TaxID=3157070 RepID=UPI0033F304D9